MSKKSKKRSNTSTRNVDRQSVPPIEAPKPKLTFRLAKSLLIYLLIDKAFGVFVDELWTQIFKIGKASLLVLLNFGLFPLILHTANQHGWEYVAFSCVGALIPYFIAKHMGRDKQPKETIQILKMFGVVWCVWWTIVFQLDPLFAVFTIIWIVIGSIMDFSYKPLKTILAKKYKDLLMTSS
jgi:hypothetical protein